MKAEQVAALNIGFTPSGKDIGNARAVLKSEPEHSPMALTAASAVEWADACARRDQAATLAQSMEADKDDSR